MLQCSRRCGSGTQKRKASCVDVSGIRMPDKECSHEVKIVAQACNKHPCPKWVRGEWTEVSWLLCPVRCTHQGCNMTCPWLWCHLLPLCTRSLCFSAPYHVVLVTIAVRSGVSRATRLLRILCVRDVSCQTVRRPVNGQPVHCGRLLTGDRWATCWFENEHFSHSSCPQASIYMLL